jgi:hypothetical protein
MQDAVCLTNVCLSLHQGELDGPLDAIKCESDHIFCADEVPVPLIEFLFRQWILSILVASHCRLRENSVNSMNQHPPDHQDMASVK